MGKNTKFSDLPIFNQSIKFYDKTKIIIIIQLPNNERHIDIFINSNHVFDLTDNRMPDADPKRLYIIDSTTISLSRGILKVVGRNPKEISMYGEVKAHMVIKPRENVFCLIWDSEAASHDHLLHNEVFILASGSIIIFDKRDVDYAQQKHSLIVRYGM